MSVNPPPPYGSPPPPPPPPYQPDPYGAQYPPQPPPSYGGPMAGPPPKSDKKWLVWAAAGCGCAVVALALFGVFMFLGIKAGTAGAEEVVKKFLSATAAERYAEAYECFSAPLKAAQSYEEFASSASNNLHLFKVKDTTFNQRSVDTTSAKLEGSVTLESGTEVPAKFQLVKENGEWKLIGYNIAATN